MDSFLPRYNDPIVSILLLLGIIFIVSVLSYAYSIWRQEQRSKELLGFLKNFDSNECLLDTQNMEYEESMKKPLFLLGLAYQNSGEYSKAISLYVYLLKHSKDDTILENLAQVYFRAGFLKRALSVYLEILSHKPRSIEALYQLEFIYEKLNDYENAKDALNVLSALGQKVDGLEVHLKYQQITKAFSPNSQKFDELLEFLGSDEKLNSYIVRKLFKLEPKRAWKYYKEQYFNNLIDILYNLKKEDIDLDIISKNILLEQLFYIKGYVKNCNSHSDNFALNTLTASKKCSVSDGQLKFIYICQKCKNSYPLSFLRCPNCHRVYSSKIEVSIEQKKAKSNYSLQ